MMSISDDKQADIIDALNTTSKYFININTKVPMTLNQRDPTELYCDSSDVPF